MRSLLIQFPPHSGSLLRVPSERPCLTLSLCIEVTSHPVPSPLRFPPSSPSWASLTYVIPVYWGHFSPSSLPTQVPSFESLLSVPNLRYPCVLRSLLIQVPPHSGSLLRVPPERPWLTLSLCIEVPSHPVPSPLRFPPSSPSWASLTYVIPVYWGHFSSSSLPTQVPSFECLLSVPDLRYPCVLRSLLSLFPPHSGSLLRVPPERPWLTLSLCIEVTSHPVPSPLRFPPSSPSWASLTYVIPVYWGHFSSSSLLTQVPSFECLLNVSGMVRGERYVFGVAAYTAQGDLIGGGVGETGRAILASHPNPLLIAWAYLCQVGTVRLWITSNKCAHNRNKYFSG